MEKFKLNNDLIAASRRGDREMVKLLLDLGASPNAEGGAALLSACKGVGVPFGEDGTAPPDMEMIKLLLDRGADPDSKGGEPLLSAIRRGDRELVLLLLDRGADPSRMERELCHRGIGAPLHVAVEFGRREIAEDLIAAGADPRQVPVEILRETDITRAEWVEAIAATAEWVATSVEIRDAREAYRDLRYDAPKDDAWADRLEASIVNVKKMVARARLLGAAVPQATHDRLYGHVYGGLS